MVEESWAQTVYMEQSTHPTCVNNMQEINFHFIRATAIWELLVQKVAHAGWRSTARWSP